MNSNGGRIMKKVWWIIAIMLGLPLAVRAADGTWNVDAAGNWSTAGSWASGIPGSTNVITSTDTALFSKLLTAARTVTVDANRNIKYITFDGGNSDTNGYTLSGGSFLLTSGGAISATGAAGAHTDSISTPLTIVGNNATYAISNDSALATRRLIISGGVTGQSTAGNTTTFVLGGSNPGTNTISLNGLSNGSNGGVLALVKDGATTWRFSGTAQGNQTTWNGPITINGGSLLLPNFNQAAQYLNANSITLANTAGAQFDFGTTDLNDPIAFGSLAGGGVNGGNIVNAGYANSGIYIGYDNTSTTYGGRFIAGQNGGGINKVGTGTLTLTGSGNDAGGTTILRGGSLQLDFSLAATATDILASTRALTLQGGRLLLTGSAGAASSQTVASTTLNAGANAVALNLNSATSLLLNLKAITRNAGAVLDVTLPTGTQAITNGVRTTTTSVANSVLVSAAANGIAYATVGGTDWAGLSSSNIVAMTTYATGVGNYTSANNVEVTDGDSVSGVTVNTLRFNGNNTLTLAATNTVSTGGILITPTAAGGATITGGTLRSGGGKELVLINNGAQFTVGSVIADSASGASALTLAGTGTVLLTGINTYTGATYIHSSTVKAGSSQAFGVNSAVTIADNPNAVLDLNGYDLTLGSLAGGYSAGYTYGTAGGRVLLGGNTLTVGTNNTSTTVGARISGSGTLFKVGTGSLALAGSNTAFTGGIVVKSGTLVVGFPRGNNPLGSATVTLGDTSGNNNATLSLNRSVSGANVVVAPGGTGVLTIQSGSFQTGAGDPTFDGTVSGTNDVVINSAANNAYFTVSGTINNVGKVKFTNPAQQSRFSVSSTIGSNVTDLTIDNNINANPNTTVSYAFSGNLSNTGQVQFTGSGASDTWTTFSGVISNASGLTVNNTGAYQVRLSAANTFSGPTLITAGKLRLDNNLALQNSPLDTSGAGTLTLNGVTTPTFGGLTGSKDLTNVITSGYTSTTALTLNPQTGKSYTYSGAITDGAANMTLTKSGPGTQALSGNNSYSGATTVSNGALRLASANALPGGIGVSGGSSLVKFAGGVLELTAAIGDFTRNLGTGATNAQFTGGGGFSAYGPNRSVNFGGATNQVTWNTNNFVPTGSSLLFGSGTADARIDFQNPINLGAGTRTIQVDDNPATTNDYALLSGAITNGALVKTGDGMLVLGASTNRFSGLTVSNGTLVVSGVTTSSILTVVSNATALINGSYADPVTVQQGGTIGGTGTLLSTLTLNAGAKLRVTIQSAEGATDALTVSNSLNVAGVTLEIVNTNLLTVGTAYTVLNGAHEGTFAGSNLPADWMIDYRPTAIKVKTSRLLGTLLKVQ